MKLGNVNFSKYIDIPIESNKKKLNLKLFITYAFESVKIYFQRIT